MSVVKSTRTLSALRAAGNQTRRARNSKSQHPSSGQTHQTQYPKTNTITTEKRQGTQQHEKALREASRRRRTILERLGPQLAMRRLVREIASSFPNDLHFETNAVDCLLHDAEAMLVDWFTRMSSVISFLYE